jgi:hypothetical protein
MYGNGKTYYINNMLERVCDTIDLIFCTVSCKNKKSFSLFLICESRYSLNYICIKLIELIYFNLSYKKYIKSRMHNYIFCLSRIKNNIKNNKQIFKDYSKNNILLNILLPDFLLNTKENKLFKDNIIKKNKNIFYNCRINFN